MANEDLLAILKQGVDVWNKWKADNPSIDVDLDTADLSRANLSGANLGRANLNDADLSTANLSGAHLSDADLSDADLRGADLSDAHLSGADLSGANLSGADLSRAHLNDAVLSSANLSGANLCLVHLSGANLSGADLSGADLRKAYLSRAYLSRANLSGADLNGAELNSANLSEARLSGSDFSWVMLFGTIFGDLDLSQVKGLDLVHHHGPSTIGTDTFAKSMGKIPDVFLRGCGLTDWEIEETKLYDPNLSNEEINKILYRMFDLRADQALQVSPLFISYSHSDRQFVDKLDECLNEKGIRFWRDIHDMKAGKIERQIDQAITQDRTVLLVLSEHSLKSDWVEHEVRKAREIAKNAGRDTLCPVALDDSWKKSAWPARIMEQIMEYNILDFSQWQDATKFDGMFRKLIDGLELFYKPNKPV